MGKEADWPAEAVGERRSPENLFARGAFSQGYKFPLRLDKHQHREPREPRDILILKQFEHNK